MTVSTIARWLSNTSRFYGSLPAVTQAGRTWTWRDLSTRAAGLGAGLLDRGLVAGDRVAIISDNHPAMLEAYYAAASSGISMAPVSTRLHAAELDRYFGRYLRPLAAIIGPGAPDRLGQWLDDCDIVVSLPGAPLEATAYDELLVDGAALDLQQDPDGPYTIGQTSGTTGFPRGARISQANAAAAISVFVAEHPLQTGDAYLIQHPMSNVPGGPGQLFPLLKGARTVLLPSFDPGVCLRTVERESITHTVLVPAMLRSLMDHPGRQHFDTSSLKSVVVGASPVPKPLLEEAVEAFGEVFLPMYGMTESVSVACVLRHGDMYPAAAQAPGRLQSAGRPSAGVELRVLDEAGREVPADGRTYGEIQLRGGFVIDGYVGDGTGASWTADGFFRTGDVATVDPDGFVTIVDRLKDIVISGGTNVASREVEEVLLAMPGVRDVAVIGTPHERWVEVVTAVVVPDADGPKPGEIEAWARTQLGGPKVPRRIEFVDELPRNAMGKVLKRELRARFGA